MLPTFDIDGNFGVFDIKVYVHNIGYDIGYDIGCCIQTPMEFTVEQQPSLHEPPCASATESQLLVPWILAPSFCAFPLLAPQRID